MLIIAVVIAACVGAHAAEERVTSASTFRPWALNDSKAFVFPRIAEKRNRGRRERLAAALRKDGDAIDAALRAGVDWNSLGVAWPRGALRRLPAAFAALVANGRADRAMLEFDGFVTPSAAVMRLKRCPINGCRARAQSAAVDRDGN